MSALIATDETSRAIEARLAELTAFIGDDRAWRYELDGDPAEMDAAVTTEASYMEGKLYETVGELLGFFVDNVRRRVRPEELAEASPSRVIVFRFVEIDDCPRRFKGPFQAVVLDERLTFVGPADAFRSNFGGAPMIGEDLDRALMEARGETGPTQREAALAESLEALASSAKPRAAGGKPCRMCDGTGRGTCNLCHGKGCSACKSSGRSSYKCISCKGAGEK